MTVTIKIPSPLRKFTERQASVQVEGQTVQEALQNLIAKYAELKAQIYDENNALRSFVNIYVASEDIRSLQGLETTLKEEEQIMIVPAIAGGSTKEVFDRQEYLRYSRHFTLEEVGLKGQQKLKEASVLIVGAGGLGSPVSIYLACAGVGHIGLVDYDTVDISNLQRQILYTSLDVGKAKLDVAKQRLSAINPQIEISTYKEPFLAENAIKITKDYDLIIDGTDNFPTRYLVNDVCVFQKKPNVYGSIFRFDGQVSFFDAQQGPCYRCLYPTPPPPGLVPSCAEGGVLGVLPGIVGSLQATEAIKWITGAGENLLGQLLIFDALAIKFQKLKLRKNEDCPVCGKNPTITEPIDYQQFCGVSSIEEVVSVPEISPKEVKHKMDRKEDFILLDVRETWEWEIAHIKEALLIPQNDVANRLSSIDITKDVVVLCKAGGRSSKIAKLLLQEGFTKVKNMTGGIKSWTEEVDTSLNLY